MIRPIRIFLGVTALFCLFYFLVLVIPGGFILAIVISVIKTDLVFDILEKFWAWISAPDDITLLNEEQFDPEINEEFFLPNIKVQNIVSQDIYESMVDQEFIQEYELSKK